MYQEKHLDTLHEIRSLMERSSRFISLSGLSGVGAGVFALLGATAAFWYLGKWPFGGKLLGQDAMLVPTQWNLSPLAFFVLDASLVLIGALASSIFFTVRKARRKGQKVWDKLTQRLLLSLTVPLAAGGIFCVGLFWHGGSGLIAPAMLIFYGLALVNASKFTLHDIYYLGIIELVLGSISLFNLGYGLEFWTIGFGLLHIVYGIAMYWKYERST